MQTSPMANASTRLMTVSSKVATSLAHTTRERRGSRVKVTSALRWLHSLVTSMIARNGSRNDIM